MDTEQDLRGKSQEDVYRALRKHLGKEPVRSIWDRLLSERYVNDVVDKKQSRRESLNCFETLVSYYEFAEPISSNTPRQTRRPEPFIDESPDERREWLAKLAAIDAAKMGPVLRFRREVLGGQLLNLEDIEHWIEGKLKEEPAGEGKETISIRVQTRKPYTRVWARIMDNPSNEPDADTIMELGRTLIDDMKRYAKINQYYEAVSNGGYARGFSVSTRHGQPNLSYLIANGGKHRKHVMIAPDGVLDELAKISKMLSEYYQWDMAESVVFVLTDIPPSPLKSQAVLNWHNEIPALDTITITVPRSTSPQKLTAFYSDAKQNFQRSDDEHKTKERYRQLDEKMLLLAAFTRKHQGETVRERLLEWNQEIESTNPKWKYKESDTFNFDKHSKRAVNSLIGME